MMNVICDRCKKQRPDTDSHEERKKWDSQQETLEIQGNADTRHLCDECGQLLWQFLQGHAIPALGIRQEQYGTILAAIERIVGDEECEDWDCISAIGTGLATDREKRMHEKLSLVYRIVHSGNPLHSCYSVHDKWRELARDVLDEKKVQV